jgi:hypothetical protein
MLNNKLYQARDAYYASITLGMVQGCNGIALMLGFNNPWAIWIRKQCEAFPVALQGWPALPLLTGPNICMHVKQNEPACNKQTNTHTHTHKQTHTHTHAHTHTHTNTHTHTHDDYARYDAHIPLTLTGICDAHISLTLTRVYDAHIPLTQTGIYDAHILLTQTGIYNAHI